MSHANPIPLVKRSRLEAVIQGRQPCRMEWISERYPRPTQHGDGPIFISDLLMLA